MGSVHPQAYYPLLVVLYLTGYASLVRAWLARARGIPVPEVPGRRLLLAAVVLVLLQLVPLPPALLRLVSPGSFDFYDIPPRVPPVWHPVSVAPANTFRGLLFLGGLSLLYATVIREFRRTRWRRRLAWTIVVTGAALTFVALLQSASRHPHRLYGIWEVDQDWAVFGPYLNRHHFAGFLEMAIPVGLGLAIESVQAALALESRRGWWRALGDPAGSAALRRIALALFLIAGLLASQSRGGFVAFAVSIPVLLFLLRQRLAATLVVTVPAVIAFLTVDLSVMIGRFETASLQHSRLSVWADMLRLVPHFPWLGAGLDAFGPAFRPYQTLPRMEWWAQAHNDYLQCLFDLGILGALLLVLAAMAVVRAALRQAGTGPLAAGIAAAVAASAVHALVDFNWQIPANAATFVALVGLLMARASEASGAPLPRSSRFSR